MGADQPAVRTAEHNGDATIEVHAADEAGCLRGAVQGLGWLAGVAGGAAGSDAVEERAVAVTGDEPVARLVALLDEVIALTDTEGLAAADADVTVGEGRADARLRLVPIDPGEAVAPPKAATWHGAGCAPAGDGRWRARVIVDR